MAQGNFDPCFGFTIGEEGKYSGIPGDPGNWSSGEIGVGKLIGTCCGISAPTLLAWVGPEAVSGVTQDYMRSLSIDTVKAIYIRNYWNQVRGEELPIGLDLTVWDFGVNAGPKRSIEQLQAVIGVDVDGDIGPDTMAKIADFDIPTLIGSLIEVHEQFYKTRAGFTKFGEGWEGRQEKLKIAALAMAK